MLKIIEEFLQDESGMSASEYGLVASLVSLVGFPAWTFFGEVITGWFVLIDSSLIGAMATL